MTKVCSFIPAATRMIYDMGLQDYLYGITFECPSEALKEKTVVVRSILEGKQLSSTEIDKIFSASKTKGQDLYYVEDEKLQAISPDIIFTQDVCEVCQIDTKCTLTAVAKLKKQPKLVTLTPQTLSDVYQTVITIASALGKEEVAYEYLAKLKKSPDAILDKLREHKMPLKRVMIMEWMEPIYNCGHWIPFQAAQAGGIDMLSNPAGDSIVTPWEKVLKYNPEILVVAPCGFDINRTLQEIHLLTERKGWNELEAVKTNSVYLADYYLFTQPSASTLANGIEVLAGLFHPDLFEVPERLKNQYKHINTLVHA